MTGNDAITLEGVTKSYARGKGAPVLDALDLRVTRGSIHGILGPNGAGKTTAVRIMATLLMPDDGRVIVAGYDAVRDGAAVRRRIGLVGQRAAVDDALTGRQNLVMFARLNGFRTVTARRIGDELLDRFELADAADRPVKSYSGGMRRRLDLAAGLVVAPEVLFVDEPTTGLDPGIRREVWRAIRALADQGTTVVLTTQYLEEADQLADRISLLGRGRVAAEGTPAELKAEVGDDWLEVSPADDSQADDIVRALTAWATGPITTAAGVVRVPLADRATAVLDATAALRDTGIGVRDVALRTPTLDEVFLQVTGRTALEDATSPAPGLTLEGAQR